MINLLNGDCIKELKKLEENSIDLLITSPPYNCGIDYGEYKDNLEWKEYLSWCKNWLIEIKRVLKKDGRICLNILIDMGLDGNTKRVSPLVSFYNLFEEIELIPNGIPIWIDYHRGRFTAWGSWLSASSPYLYCPFESVLIGYKEQWKKENKGKSTINKEEFMIGCSGVWKLRTETKQLTKSNFHLDLPSLCIKLLSYENDIVCDPFMGSGTTGVACKMLNRNFVGIELNKKYYEIAQKRINNTTEPLLQ